MGQDAFQKRTGFLHDEICLWHSTAGLYAGVTPVGAWVQPPAAAGLAESPESKRRIVSLLQVSGLMSQLALTSAPPASELDLLRVHTAEYTNAFRSLSAQGGGELGDYAPFGPGSYEKACQSAGLAIAAVSGVLQGRWRNAYAMSRPPGHHCLADRAMGFCLLANIPIAVEAARAHHGLGKVVILDWDVHHGNGTQSIYNERADTLTISLHQENCFPPGYSGTEDRGQGAGRGFNINIPLQPGGGHQSYMDAFERIVIPAIDRFAPELIVVACGFDANAQDPLARMSLGSRSFRAMTQAVMALAHRHCHERLVLVHEGGYAESVVPFCAHAVMETLSGIQTDVEDPFTELFDAQAPGDAFVRWQRDLLEVQARALGL